MGLVKTVRENAADGISALKLAAEEIKGAAGGKTGVKKEEAQPQTFACGECHTEFSAPPEWKGQSIKCPNPACGREYTKEELEA